MNHTFSMPYHQKVTKNICYKNINFPIDFELFQQNSEYFRENKQKYESIDTIEILEEEKNFVDFSSDSIRDFVNCCQSQTIEITSENVFELHYLSKKYKVFALKDETMKFITENKKSLAIDSLIFNLKNPNCQLDTNEEESAKFDKYIKACSNDYYGSILCQMLDLEVTTERKFGIVFICLFFVLFCFCFCFYKLSSQLQQTRTACEERMKDQDKKYSDLIGQIKNETNQKIEGMTAKYNELKEQLASQNISIQNISPMKKQIEEMERHLYRYEKIEYFIPVGQKWKQKEDLNHFILDSPSKKIEVESSSYWDKTHLVTNLFTGKKETADKIKAPYNRWAKAFQSKNPYIQVKFSNKVICNVIKITARNIYYPEAPQDFEVFGIDDKNAEKSLRKFKDTAWSPIQTQYFHFGNSEPFSGYKIKFYDQQDKLSFSELNFGNSPYL